VIYIICGHYGSGKTEIAINLALSLDNATIIDLDIVNPYFRTADAKEKLESSNVRVITPQFANTNIDMPTVPAEVFSALTGEGNIIFDVGGDDAGAIALGQYNRFIKEKKYEVQFVINACRPMTENADDTIKLMREIEAASRLKVTKLINNTNLKSETTKEIISDGQDLVNKVSDATGIPIGAVSGKKELLDTIKTDFPKLPLELHLDFPWERGV